ncbi:hypothetical protein GUJ93_ZPchr0013g36763 [Zizania palustris]|uniref:Uncharacterized protein n=1 Tax=Zizania palustris TaxID=103762 RepID=A0A8J5WQP3_ZIZPA|nr:hypothetical protein GUJ93_ZPchr0013g36763 [Zizania palustris]
MRSNPFYASSQQRGHVGPAHFAILLHAHHLPRPRGNCLLPMPPHPYCVTASTARMQFILCSDTRTHGAALRSRQARFFSASRRCASTSSRHCGVYGRLLKHLLGRIVGGAVAARESSTKFKSKTE